MSFNELAEWRGNKIVWPGDTISVVWNNPLTGEEDTVITCDAKKEHIITVAKILEFEKEFGMKDGIAAIIGDDSYENKGGDNGS